MKLLETKSKIQNEAIKLWNKNKRGTLAIATGVGKTLIGVNISLNYKNVLIVVPTEKLRDDRWPDEFKKWKHKDNHITRECYASLSRIDLSKYDLIILDEGHNVTVNNSKNFKNYKGDILCLTATPPRDEEKLEIFNTYFPIIFEYTVDEAVRDNVVAPYQIKIVEYYLDSKTKNIKAGNKKKQFMNTELAHYNYLSRTIDKIRYSGKEVPKFMYLNRMRFLYNLPSKLKIAKKILDNYIKDERCLIFAGSIQHAENLCKYTFHSKTTDDDYNNLIKGKINRLASVDKLKEGHDLPNMDSALLTKINSNPKDFIQSMGRVIRWRDGHKGTIWILCALNTQEENWVNKAIESLDITNIEYINYKNL